MAPLVLRKTIFLILFMTLSCLSLTTSLSLKKVVGMMEAAKNDLGVKLNENMKKTEETMKKTKMQMEDEFVDEMKNFTKELLKDLVDSPELWLEKVTEIRSCLTHPCQNEGICHLEDDVCLCQPGFAGPHCEKCSTGFTKKDETCVPDGTNYLAMKPYQGSQYLIGTKTNTWYDARNACKKLNGDLAAAETTAEWSHIWDEINRVDRTQNHWIGASGQGVNGGWHWVTGGDITSTPKGVGGWYSNQPHGSGKQCMRSGHPHSSFGKNNNWIDDVCSTKFKFICEYRK